MSGEVIPKSRIYAYKDTYIPKECRKDYLEEYHTKRARAVDTAKKWEYLADALEKEMETYVQEKGWESEEDDCLDEIVDED